MTNHLKVHVSGEAANLFFYDLICQKINFYSVEKRNSEISFIIHSKDYSRVVKIPTTCKVKIVRRYGFCWYRYLLVQYWYLFLFVFLGLFFDFCFSHFIFQIEIVHPNQELVSIIEQDLKNLGLKKYALKLDYVARESIKEKLLKKEEDILEWIEIEEIGTKYKITLQERKKKRLEEICYPRHLVSKKNAILLEIDSSSGEIVKKKNDYVEKGEIIVSGFIHNKEKIVSKKCAIGQVYGEVWYRVKVSMNSFLADEQLLKDKERHFYIQFFDLSFGRKPKFSTFQKKEYYIIEGKVVPIYLGFVEYQKIVRREYSHEDIVLLAVEKAYQEILQTLQEEEEILSKKVLKIEVKDSRIDVEVFFKVKEDITDYFDISDIEMENIEED